MATGQQHPPNSQIFDPVWKETPEGIQGHGVFPSKREPNYIQRCRQRQATGEGGWALELWNTATGETLNVPYCCGSWRHEGDCRDRYRRVEMARIGDALRGRKNVYFAVLTVDEQHRGVRRSYAKLGRIWPILRKRLRRSFGKFDYVATVEEHRSGHPHLNLIIATDAPELRAATARKKRQPKWFRDMAKASGWGWAASFERARSAADVTAYVSKVCSGQVAAEVSKLTQLPTHAPKGARRLRSSRGFLPPRTKHPDWTGKLHFSSVEEFDAFERAQWQKTSEQVRKTALLSTFLDRSIDGVSPVSRASLARSECPRRSSQDVDPPASAPHSP